MWRRKAFIGIRNFVVQKCMKVVVWTGNFKNYCVFALLIVIYTLIYKLCT